MMRAKASAAEQRLRRFSDEMFVAPIAPRPVTASPGKPALPDCCPFCDQKLPHARASCWQLFGGGIRRLFLGLGMILLGVARVARLAIAASLCLIGLIGFCCRSLGVWIAHPHDRRFLARRAARRTEPSDSI